MTRLTWIRGDLPAGEIIREVESRRAAMPGARVVNLYAPFREAAAPFEHVFFRDLISQEEEEPILRQAYALARLTLPDASADPVTRAVLFGMHHDIATQFTYYFICRHLEERFPGEALIVITPFPPLSDKELLRHWRNRARRYFLEGTRRGAVPADPSAKAAAGQPLVMCGDDSGSGVNSSTFLPLAAALRDAGQEIRFFSLGRRAQELMREMGVAAMVLDEGPPPSGWSYVRVLACCAWRLRRAVRRAEREGLVPRASGSGLSLPRLATADSLLRAAAMSALNVTQNYIPHCITLATMVAALARRGARVAACVKEGSAASAALAALAPRLGLLAMGVPTVLLMDHPNCHYFPAQHHLAYGDQHVELLHKAGVADKDITLVGSHHFDRAHGRDMEADRQHVRELLPDWDGRPLVVIATESRPRQMLEIEPTLTALAGRPDLRVVLKLHPGDPPALFEPILEGLGRPSHITMIGRCDVLALVHACDLLVTMGSNLVVEAGVMGRLSLCYNYSGARCPMDFVAEGICLGATSPGECLHRIDAMLADTPTRREALERLKNVQRYNAFNDGAALRRMTDALLNASRRQAGGATPNEEEETP